MREPLTFALNWHLHDLDSPSVQKFDTTSAIKLRKTPLFLRTTGFLNKEPGDDLLSLEIHGVFE